MPSPRVRLVIVSVLSIGLTAALLAPQAPAEPPRPPAPQMQPAVASEAVQAVIVTTTTQPPTTTTTLPPPPPTTTTTQALPPPPTTESPPPSGSGDPDDPASWDRLADCETGGTMDWATDTGNGYMGGLQFSQSSWESVGGTGSPAAASREEQIRRGQLLWEQGGWQHWPGCSRSFGWI